ncbi:MAG TPA: hypothetical protein VGQ52_05625 [Gemmatimonadaceae bacterium]|jgi:hypothetical protein|nr:hypothetical protein [Gemmatimonadaceae bacterium]
MSAMIDIGHPCPPATDGEIAATNISPHVRFDCDRAEANARAVNPDIQYLRVSAESGAGLDTRYDWLRSMRADLALPVAS